MSEHVNYRRFRVTFEFEENAPCIRQIDHGIKTISDYFEKELFPSVDVVMIPDTLEIKEVQQ